ncbi:AAA family ATPase [Synechococcus sp. Cruz-9H2]|uniref:AAA family ATPase n=1 Tax=Synechococcus sp. Cruz-9H2 TaxID=2823732 RepID=UPI0020CCFBD4|nr:AAA family ATPase [Synechococcus sp. Cruz-9H2]
MLLDEVQEIPGWDGFLRRLIDSEPLDVVVSGCSAPMISAAIATSLRGLALEAIVWPFSFWEALRHVGLEPSGDSSIWTSADRSQLQHQLERYLLKEAFPEAQGLDERSSPPLLLSYVDSTVRQLLNHAGVAFCINRLHQSIRSRFDLPPLRVQRPRQPGPRP